MLLHVSLYYANLRLSLRIMWRYIDAEIKLYFYDLWLSAHAYWLKPPKTAAA